MWTTRPAGGLVVTLCGPDPRSRWADQVYGRVGIPYCAAVNDRPLDGSTGLAAEYDRTVGKRLERSALKQTISRVLPKHALDFLGRAEEAKNEKRPVDEISACMGAHLMIAITVEGIANELGAIVFGGALLDHFDRVDTAMKWYLLSELSGRVAFDFGQEPLQTIQMVVSTRNRIAHPKVENFGGRGDDPHLIRQAPPQRQPRPSGSGW